MGSKVKKILSIVMNVLVYAFIAVIALFLIFTIVFGKLGSDATSILGYQFRTVISPSMEECELTDVSNYDIKSLPLNTMIFIEEVPTDFIDANEWYSDLEVGDVLTFKYLYVRQEVITHRIIKIEDNGKGGYYIYLEGDNKNTESGILTQMIDTSNEFSPNYVIGKVVGHSYVIGSLVTFLRSTIGLVLIIVVIVVILILEVLKLAKLLTHDKREAEKKKQQAQLDELEELRKKVALLEKNNNEG
jgi:signal peptidase